MSPGLLRLRRRTAWRRSHLPRPFSVRGGTSYPLLAKVGVIGGATVVLCCGLATFGLIASLPDAADESGTNVAFTSAPRTSSSSPQTGQPAGEPTAAMGETASPTMPAYPVIEKRTVTERKEIPFAKRTVQDPSLPKGTTKVRTKGVKGVKTLTYEVTYTDGVETDRKLVREVITKAPVTEVVAVGTKETATQKCDPNYAGACVPIASDVDCAGGGDGPAYVQGPVRVVGKDIYRLDSDGDGIGCE